MIQNIPTTTISYIDANGNLTQNPAIKSVMVRTEDDLELIKNPTPGDRAYLADESKLWAFDAIGEWHEVVKETSSGESSDDNSNVFVVTFTEQYYDENTNDNIFTCDHTLDEILTAQAAGKLIMGQIGGIALTFSGTSFTSIYFVSLDVDITDNTFSVTYIDWDNQQNRWRSVGNNYTLTLKG